MKPAHTRPIARARWAALMLTAALALGACGDERATGRLDLDLAGSVPQGMAKQVWVEVSGVTLGHTDGSRVQIGFEPRRRVDLVTLGWGQSEPLLRDAELPAGPYEWLQLHLNTRGRKDTYLVTLDDARHELVVPARQRDPLRIDTPFRVAAGAPTHRTIVFRLHPPLEETGTTSGSYALKPILRAVDTSNAAHITATVARPFLKQHCRTPHDDGIALYVFPGADAVPDDIDGARGEPTAIAPATGDDDDTPLQFRASFLAPGDYTLALTCTARHDRPDTDNQLAFFGVERIRLVAGRTVKHAF